MRFVHTSDWHLGRMLHGQQLAEDQAHVLDQVVRIVADVRPDALLVAGDVHDRAVPPLEAVRLLDDVLGRVALGLKVPVVLIAGNHDSPERLGFGRGLLEAAGVHVVGPLTDAPRHVMLHDSHGPVSVCGIPFADPAHARLATGDATLQGHDAALRSLVARARPGAARRSVLLAHAFVVGGEESESERPLAVGGSGTVGVDAFDGFSYVALGHLHRPQAAGRPDVRYSGSLLPYSFSEADHVKGVLVVELDAAGRCEVESIPLQPRRGMRILEGTLAELLQGAATDASPDDWILARLTDHELVLDPMGRLREAFPNVLQVQRLELEARGDAAAPRVDPRSLAVADIFASFYQDVTGEVPTPAEEEAFARVAEEQAQAEREAES